ncbi:hypothetical protein D6D08_03694 [Aureobasidium pullulans]|nr:hypothetical protein D6D08_03694 [Aureobasidium pullulans]
MKGHIFFFAALAAGASADLTIFEAGLITNSSDAALSEQCVTAMQDTLPCDPSLRLLTSTETFDFLPVSVIDTLCSADCGKSLAAYHAFVARACAGDPKPWQGMVGLLKYTWPIENGTSGYVGWSAIHRCTSGQLSGCDASTVEGIYVEACTPFPPSGDVELSGTTAAITTDRSTAEALTCNPANTTAAQNGSYSISCSTADSQPEEGAAGGLGGVSLVLLFGSLLVAFVGI